MRNAHEGKGASSAEAPAAVLSRRQLLELGAAGGIVLVGGGLVGACGGDEGPAGARGAVEGTISYVKGPFSDVDLRIQRQLARGFERQHPKARIKPSLYAWESREAELTTAFASPSPPDVSYQGDAIWVPFAAAGGLVDLTERVSAESFAETFAATPDRFWEAAKHDGKTYGVPVYTASSCRLVNRDLMQRAGVTDWNSSVEAMRAAARQVRERTQHFGYATATASTDFNSYGQTLSYIFSAGGSVLSDDFSASTINTPAVAAQFDELRGMYVDDRACPRPGLYDSDGLNALWRRGRLAQLETFTNLVAAQTAPEDVKFDWTLETTPPGAEGEPAVYGAVGMLFIAAKSKHVDTAWEYIRYLSGRDTVLAYLRDYPDLGPARTDVPATYVEGNPSGEAVYDFYNDQAVKVARAVPAYEKWPPVSRILGEEYEQLLLGKKSGAETVAAMGERIDAVIAGGAA
jgi:ABC-type glycerol-3-phosphate transport system substrate-binding protein